MKLIFLSFFLVTIFVSNGHAFDQKRFERAIINDDIKGLVKISKEKGGDMEREVTIASKHFAELNKFLDLAQVFISKNDLSSAAKTLQDAIDSGVHYKATLTPFVNGKECKSHLNEIIRNLIYLNEICNRAKQ